MAYPPLNACALTTSVRPPHQMRPDPKPLDVPERFYKRFGPPIAERVHAVHVGDASPPDQPPT
ncbi:hypothetical protein B0H14DRAFT_3500009 [Mycena olivaceomarginata]|nr:hypothetical protein B0H14DRAFT_3500009 [Mycena olivaceomarginata]